MKKTSWLLAGVAFCLLSVGLYAKDPVYVVVINDYPTETIEFARWGMPGITKRGFEKIGWGDPEKRMLIASGEIGVMQYDPTPSRILKKPALIGYRKVSGMIWRYLPKMLFEREVEMIVIRVREAGTYKTAGVPLKKLQFNWVYAGKNIKGLVADIESIRTPQKMTTSQMREKIAQFNKKYEQFIGEVPFTQMKAYIETVEATYQKEMQKKQKK